MEDNNSKAQTDQPAKSFLTSIKPGLSLVSRFFEVLWHAVLGLVSLVWELATQGLKMILDTLKEIPPMVIGLVSATLLCWFGLTLLTSNETILTIFAITLSLLAIGAMGLAYLQKWFDHKKSIQKAEWERMDAAMPKADPLQERLLALEKFSELLKKIPVEAPENAANLEAATTRALLNILEQVNGPAELMEGKENLEVLALQDSRPAGKKKG